MKIILGICLHNNTTDISGMGCINIVCLDCGAHKYQYESTPLQWISRKDWESWIESSDELFGGKGYEYFKQNRLLVGAK